MKKILFSFSFSLLIFFLASCGAQTALESFGEEEGSVTVQTTEERSEHPAPPETEIPISTEPSIPTFRPEEMKPVSRGIDVSKWQGRIDWKKVAESGVEFAMIRVGWGNGDGSCGLDSCALYNLAEAPKYGIRVGVYLYSAADTPDAARAEAEFVLNTIEPYQVTFPVVIDVEMESGTALITARSRTNIALGFLERVEEAGYQGMLYVPMEEFENPSLWEASRLLESFPVWAAFYDGVVYPDAEYPETELCYAMWQYSNTGRTAGISGDVDQNVCYTAF